MYITISMIIMAMRQGLEEKCEAVGQGSSPNDCHLSTVACVYGAAVESLFILSS